MPIILHFYAGKNSTLTSELAKLIKSEQIGILSRSMRKRGGIPIPEIVVALGSAGVFTALYQIICKLLEKNKDRELTIERDGNKVTIKGHSLPEERTLLKQLAPEFLKEDKILNEHKKHQIPTGIKKNSEME